MHRQLFNIYENLAYYTHVFGMDAKWMTQTNSIRI